MAEVETLSYGFLGAGRMATALAQGLVARLSISPARIVASDCLPAACEAFSAVTGAQATPSNAAVLAAADVIFLAVKPQQIDALTRELRGQWQKKQLLISIAAGVRMSQLAAAVEQVPRLVRVMPNTPCLVGQGASAYCLGPGATPEDGALVARLLGAVGQAHAVNESMLDAVTGLSGSGPAFVYAMIEALSDGGVRMGLPRDLATALAAQTVKGSAEMVLATGQHPAVLKEQVTSPGGTTIAGLQVIEDRAVRAAFLAAVEAATRRSIELGQAEPPRK